MQWKNEYRFSGIIEKIYPLETYTYNEKEYRRRDVLVVNKHKRRGRWFVGRAIFTFKTEDAISRIQDLEPKQDVIVSFSIDTEVWFKGKEKERHINKLTAWDIFSPRDKFVDDKWMSIKNFEPVSSKEDVIESMPSLTEERKLKAHPEDKGYDASDYDRSQDYSELPNDLENVKDKGDLPF